MSRPFIAAVVTVALALSGLSASTAQAGNRDVVRALTGIAAVAIIAGALSENNNRKYNRRDGHVSRGYHGPAPVVTPRPLPRRVQRYALPRDCMIRAQSRYGQPRRVFGGRCLNRAFRFTDSLPRACAVQISGAYRGDHRQTGYDVRCLRKHGYHLARR
jgi:hypothetical protein